MLLKWGRGVGGAGMVAAITADVPVAMTDTTRDSERRIVFIVQTLRKNPLRWPYLKLKQVNDHCLGD
jgi:hypothetical protein